MRITVVTPWLGHEDLYPEYANAIEAGQPDDLILIDNGSDPALPFATHRFNTNIGFQRANNHGLNKAATEAVLFLNNDVVMVRPDWLDTIRSTLLPGVLVGAQLRHDAHTTVDGHLVPYLDGWCVAGMTADLLALGGWDETLEEPAYYGDNLLSLRARAAGLELVAATVGLKHLGSVTSRSLDWHMVEQITLRNCRIYQQAVREFRAHAAVAG